MAPFGLSASSWTSIVRELSLMACAASLTVAITGWFGRSGTCRRAVTPLCSSCV